MITAKMLDDIKDKSGAIEVWISRTGYPGMWTDLAAITKGARTGRKICINVSVTAEFIASAPQEYVVAFIAGDFVSQAERM